MNDGDDGPQADDGAPVDDGTQAGDDTSFGAWSPWAMEPSRQTMADGARAHGDALRRGDLAAARMAAVIHARSALNFGHIAWATRILYEVDGLAARPDASPPDDIEVAMTAVVRGRVAELRGELTQAEAIYAEALAELDDAVHRDVTRVVWAITVATLSTESAAAVAVEMEELKASTTVPAIRLLADLGLGLAIGHLGDGDGGTALAERALDHLPMVHEAAQMRVRLGEMLFHLGDMPRAAAQLSQALDVFDEVGGSYWAARALCGLACTGTVDEVDALARARLLSDGDVAFDRLFVQEEGLTVRLDGEVGVYRGTAPLAFAGRQAEFVVLVLAAVAPDTVSLEELCGALWPAPDRRRLPQRVRTLLWQVRRALGADAWRMGRDGDRLWLDVRGITVVGADPEGGDDVLDGWHHMGDGPRQWLRDMMQDDDIVLDEDDVDVDVDVTESV